MNETTDTRRFLPSVDKILQHVNQTAGMDTFSHEQKVDAARNILNQIRLSGVHEPPEMEEIIHQVVSLLELRQKAGIRRVVNGAGIILHTGLGRAVLPREAMDAVKNLDGYSSLQIDLETGERGRRDAEIEEILHKLTGAEAATVVNNNAAATLLVLTVLCKDQELIVSRGQLIEIGGSFRLPDIIAASGARMVEVGTTNKTHLRDYENAITEHTRVLLRVNPSNYRIIGFSKMVPTKDLVSLKTGRDLIVVDDLGCGALVDLRKFGLPYEATVQDSIAAGADVALFSGDKLISGPQAGIIVGKKENITKIRKHPLARAMRVGKFTIAALEATLKLFLNPETMFEKIPVLRMITTPLSSLQNHATALSQRLAKYASCEVRKDYSVCGGGSLPDCPLETAVVAISHADFTANELAKKLRLGEPSVVTRVQDEKVHIDVRTLLDGDDERIENAIKELFK
ncbi:MAG: L-seryl-tRNA(Sec) selenium transferase [Candidatus Omnitrophota bacterium]|jgi:L-seryl-tRNA(Ser) seleniumtransferase|nr:MAG: L-seryl-tRNA(Sec) selenium transferase [Candidatus Omnitrophota bacterium]